MRDHNLLPADPTTAESVRTMLKADTLFFEDAPQAVVAYLTDLAKRAAERRGIAHAMVQVEIFADGTGAVAFGPEKRFGSYSEPLCDAVRAAEEWLSRDVVGEVNATLGMTADGRLPPKLTVVKRVPPNRPGNPGYPHARND